MTIAETDIYIKKNKYPSVVDYLHETRNIHVTVDKKEYHHCLKIDWEKEAMKKQRYRSSLLPLATKKVYIVEFLVYVECYTLVSDRLRYISIRQFSPLFLSPVLHVPIKIHNGQPIPYMYCLEALPLRRNNVIFVQKHARKVPCQHS